MKLPLWTKIPPILMSLALLALAAYATLMTQLRLVTSPADDGVDA